WFQRLWWWCQIQEPWRIGPSIGTEEFITYGHRISGGRPFLFPLAPPFRLGGTERPKNRSNLFFIISPISDSWHKRTLAVCSNPPAVALILTKSIYQSGDGAGLLR